MSYEEDLRAIQDGLEAGVITPEQAQQCIEIMKKRQNGIPYSVNPCNFTRDVQKAVDFEMRVAEIHAKRAADLLDNCGNVALFNALQEDVMRGIKHIRSVCAPEYKQAIKEQSE